MTTPGTVPPEVRETYPNGGSNKDSAALALCLCSGEQPDPTNPTCHWHGLIRIVPGETTPPTPSLTDLIEAQNRALESILQRLIALTALQKEAVEVWTEIGEKARL